MYTVYESNFSMHIRFSFFLNDTATTEIYTLSLHDALPISYRVRANGPGGISGWSNEAGGTTPAAPPPAAPTALSVRRSEEHTSELQSQSKLVCRLLLEKKKDILTQRPQQILTKNHA